MLRKGGPVHRHIGKRLGAYQLLEQIGQGGMATIFKAYQPSMDRYVAIKVLPSHFTEDETFVARFTQEARTLARLEHPHILPVHDYGEQEGLTYLVMRYIEAGTLKDWITRKGPVELDEAVRILDQVGRALDYAHSQGVVHRDIKPTNVLIDERGDAFLTDFGIAKLVAGTAQFTATGAIVGTPAYMSPEQGMGKSIDHRSDIYSLGVVLYELVTGRVPFEAETPLAVLLQHVNAPLPVPRQVKPDLPQTVERVILKAMAKAPDDRFQSVGEMVEALHKSVTGMPTEIGSPRRAPEALQTTVSSRAVSPPAQPVPQTALPGRAPGGMPTEPRVVAPPRRTKPWLVIAGGVAVVAMVLIAAILLIVPKLRGSGTEPPPTATQGLAEHDVTAEVPPTAIPPTATPTAEPPTAEPLAVEPPTVEPPTAEPPTAEPPRPDKVPGPAGWTSFSNSNSVIALARQEDYLWAGGGGGLVRWDLTDGSYVKFGVTDGLASNWVTDLLVDWDGVLWVATDAGINRFDGETWLTFDSNDGLDIDQVQTLFLDSYGALWAGTAYGERGLNYYDGLSWGPPPVPPLPVEYSSPKVLLEDEEGGLLVGLEMSGLAYFDGLEWTLLTSEDGLPSDQISDMLLTDDALWVSFGYEVARFDLDTEDWETIPQLQYVGVYAMHQASDGSIWFGGDEGVNRYDPWTGDWQEVESWQDTIPSLTVTDILEDEYGIWLATYDGGVAFYDGSGWETWITDDELGGNTVGDILQDEDGVLWFAHPGTGLSRYDPATDAWQTFREADGALDWPSYPGIDSHGNLWIGGTGELLRYDGTTWQRFAPPELMDTTVYAIEFGPKDVQWIVIDNGLMRHIPAMGEWTVFSAADHPVLDYVSAGFVGRDGTAWVGGQDGIARYDGTSWSTPATSGDSPAWVDDMAEASDGSLWVIADGSLYHLDGDQWVQFSWQGDIWIETLDVGPDGTIWAGGYGGLAQFDPRSGVWQAFTADDGLTHPTVYAIHVTPEGVVWVGTEGGVSRYVPEE